MTFFRMAVTSMIFLFAVACCGTSRHLLAEDAQIPPYLLTTLKKWKVEPTSDSIRSYLRKMQPDSTYRQQIGELIQKLGSRSYRERESATFELMRAPLLPLAPMKMAAEGTDSEIRLRVRKILSQRGAESEMLLFAIFESIKLGKIPGLVPELLKAIPECHSQYLRIAARNALLSTATKRDLSHLKMGLKSKDPQVQAAAVITLSHLLGVQFDSTIRKLVDTPETSESVLLVCARRLANQRDRDFLPLLVRLLNSNEIRIRSRAISTLRYTTGQHFGYAPYNDDDDRARVIEKWNTWIKANGKNAKLKLPLPDDSYQWWGSLLNGNTLLAFGYRNKVIEYAPTGEEVWSYDCRGAWSAEKLPNGNVLIAGYYEGKVLEVNRDKKVVWEYPVQRCLNAKLLRNGNILIAVASGRKVLEVNREKKIVWEYATKGNCRDIHRLPNGNTLVASGGIVEEVTPGKQQVWSFHASQPYGLQYLINGNLLIADWTGRVIEVTRNKKIVWEHKIQRPGDAFRLPNGNTLITTDTKFVEVTRNGKVVLEKPGCRYGTARR
ncbi:MAG: hypothetical protein Tsb009_04540 [Planctomycetaceae bacterium]